MNQRYSIDETTLAILKKIWYKEGNKAESIKPIIEIIQKNYSLKTPVQKEIQILQGITTPIKGKILKESIGKLIPLAPGIIILDATTATHLPPLSGLIRKSTPEQDSLFHLIPFFSPSFLSIYSTELKTDYNRFPNCPTWIYWEAGGETPDSLGIEPDNWEILNEWLNKWLPETK